MKKNIKMMTVGVNTLVGVIAAFTAVTAVAEPLPVPRAHDILPGASSCGIGPFGQTNKAGQYNPYCKTLTDAEKCLALIKNNMNSEGVLSKVYGDNEIETQKTAYCLEHFKAELLSDN